MPLLIDDEAMHIWFAFIEYAPRIFAIGATITVMIEVVHRSLTGRSIPYRQWGLSAVAGFTFMGSKHLFGYALILPIHLFLFRFRLFDLDLWNPAVWLAIFLVRDLVSYGVHRVEHSAKWLWASHSIHHSFEEMSPSCAMRVPWMENFYKIPAGLWMPLMGVDFRLVVGIDVIAALVSIAQHTEMFPAKPNGWIQRVFIVPSHHRVHHGSNDHYLDKNFGAVLCIWDKLFGTFEPETTPVTYGVLGRRLDTPRDMVLGKYPDLAAQAFARA